MIGIMVPRGSLLAPLPEGLQDCFRCGGAGWFRCYSHIEGGVCFRCRGYGVERKPKRTKVKDTRQMACPL
jgi:hypothetical protein